MLKIIEDTEQAAILSQQLRNGFGYHLSQRRAIVGLSLIAASSMGIITLYQVGIIRHLPEPPLPRLNADRVDASPEAYKLLETPDGILAIGNYTATAALAAMGGIYRVERQPWIPLALAAKIGFDACQSIRLFINQVTKQKVLCSYCILADMMTLASIPLVIPETIAAVKQLFSKQ
jgi:uncharacterized membrane protein